MFSGHKWTQAQQWCQNSIFNNLVHTTHRTPVTPWDPAQPNMHSTVGDTFSTWATSPTPCTSGGSFSNKQWALAYVPLEGLLVEGNQAQPVLKYFLDNSQRSASPRWWQLAMMCFETFLRVPGSALLPNLNLH